VKEATVHARAVKKAHSASVRIRQDGLGAVFGGDRLQSSGDRVDGFRPGDTAELARTFGASAGEWVEEAVGVVFAVEVFGDFTAEEALRDGVVGVAFEAGSVASWVNLNEECAGVRTV